MAERNLHQDGKHSREPPYGEANRYHRPEPEECSRYASGMSRIAIRVALGIGALAVGFYVGDWLVWRLARGAPLGVVLVTREVVAPLKSGREEYYYDGTTERTLFPIRAGTGWHETVLVGRTTSCYLRPVGLPQRCSRTGNHHPLLAWRVVIGSTFRLEISTAVSSHQSEKQGEDNSTHDGDDDGVEESA